MREGKRQEEDEEEETARTSFTCCVCAREHVILQAWWAGSGSWSARCCVARSPALRCGASKATEAFVGTSVRCLVAV